MLNAIKKQRVLLMAAALLGLVSCSKDDAPQPEPEAEKNYGVVVRAGTPAATYILNTSDLNQGALTTANNGAETNISIITQRGTFFYGINDAGNLVKFTSSNKVNTIVKEVPFKQISWASYASFFAWKDDKTLVLFSMNDGLRFDFVSVNVETMAVGDRKSINIPAPAADHYYWGNSVAFAGDKLYLSFNLTNATTSLPVGKTYLATMNFPDADNVILTEDTRFNQPAHYNLSGPATFVDNGYVYFLNSPLIWIAGETGGSFSIYRVKTGETAIDKTYEFELTDRTKEEASNMFYLGNGKAIIKIFDKTQIATWQDYSGKYIASYYVVDVVNKTKTKLNIPAAIPSPYAFDILTDGNIAQIAALTQEGYFIYVYNAATGAITKGAKLEGASTVSRLAKYN